MLKSARVVGLGAVIGIASLWFIAVGALWLLQGRMEFPGASWPGTVVAAGAFGLAETTTHDGVRLAFLASPPRAGMPVIVQFHGNGDQAAEAALEMQPLVGLGYGVVAAEYRGYSGNPGIPSEKGMIQDGLAQVAWARAQWPEAPLVLWGASLGTGVAVAIAGATRPVAVVLDSPFTSVRDLTQAIVPFAPVSILLRSPFDSLARMPGLTMPVLVLAGEADPVVPQGMGHRMIAAARCATSQSLFLPGVGHLAIRSDPSGRALRKAESFLDRVRTGAGCQLG